ncbi:unnamed protein product [Mytilus coruscus]|uniref:C2H2-type domain-containing protein n=1 Tax=Mytilus coruscus TaxID=42192 RepID=A0A6J8B1I3_MYTCO|nr:unnamed protein product [Mytilus coruscus]
MKHHDDYFAGKMSDLHECEFCGRKFLYLSQRNEHIKIHTGRRPFICKFCSKSFRTQQTLALHEKRHTNPFECGICRAQFIQKHLLLKHLKIHEDTTNRDNQEQQNTGIHLEEKTRFSHNLIKTEANNCSDSLNDENSTGAVHEQSHQFRITSQLFTEKHASMEMNEIKPEITDKIKEEVKSEKKDQLMNEQSTFLDDNHRSETGCLPTCSSGSILKAEHIPQQSISNPLSGNVLTMTKIGSVKVNAEDLQKILNRGNILDIIKSQTQNDL